MEQRIQEIVSYWQEHVQEDYLLDELNHMTDEEKIDAFYQDLKFGTGGLRGILKVGPACMNLYVVKRATLGVVSYILKKIRRNRRKVVIGYDTRHRSKEFAQLTAQVLSAFDIDVYMFQEPLPTPCVSRNRRKVVIGYDTRHRSKEFAQLTAQVLSAFDIDVYMFQEPLPTPCVSFAIRALQACMGIMITASHNPAIYNGYKVYGQDGCQITNGIAKEIYQEILQHDYFEDIPDAQSEKIIDIPEEVLNAYFDQVLSQQVQTIDSKSLKIVYTPLYGTGRKPVQEVLKRAGFKNVSIVKEQEMPNGDFPTCPKPNPEEYTPLYGTGRKPVQEVLKRAGFKNVSIVKEQEMPNGDFPTCPKPNPEEEQALALAICQAQQEQADIVLATDPDCDRVSIAVKQKDTYVILSANELGCLLLDYICAYSQNVENKVFLKTIVTTDLSEMIASHYHVRTINTLTGFKYIGEQISLLEKAGKEDQFLFGFEESCGFLKGSYVRDKDAVVASLLICEMAAFYKTQNQTLSMKNQELYQRYQTCLNTQSSYKLEGAKGKEHMDQIMEAFRYEIQMIGKESIVLKKDYKQGIDHLPPSNVIKLYLSNNASIVLRPSGTEPKLKVYYSILADDMEICHQIQKPLEDAISKIITNYQ